MEQWEINKPLGQCSGTGEEIAPGQEYYGALVEGEQGLERRDFSVQYWEENQPRVYCFWKTKLAEPTKKKPLFVDDQMLMSFFDRLADETEQERINFRFVLALILMRKRLLKYDSSRTEADREIWTMKVTGEKRTAELINPHLQPEQIDDLSAQLGEILHSEFE